jgi:RNA polymerase sigma factor (TIGR02999 family)
MTDEISEILNRVEAGDPGAAERLLPLVYEDLKRLAARKLAGEAPGHTLQATALVHEAYLRLVDSPGAAGWHNRGHFFAAAAEAMRRILIENARRKRSRKAGGGRERLALDPAELAAPAADHDLLAVDEAIDRLIAVDPEAAELVKLRFFVGLTLPETAEVLGISLRSANRRWAYARAWLYRELYPGAERSSEGDATQG